MCNSRNTRLTTACAQPSHNNNPSPSQGEGRVRVTANQYAATRRSEQSLNPRPKYPSPSQGEGRVRVRPARVAGRAAFTLVELMMSLIIIGLLASMLGVAVSYAINAAKNVATKADIANLDQALQSYKNNYGSEYPSCMAVPAMALGNVTSPSRYDLFNRSLRKRFSRYTTNYIQGGQSPPNADVSYLLYHNWYARNLAAPNDPTKAIPLNLDNMDAAESLVFWLAGPPTPTNQAPPTSSSVFLGNNVLYGFSANPTSPFMPTGSRLPSLYDFDESRLTDVDGDGWPEYTPKGSSNKSTGVPPFVYFEPNSYTFQLGNNANSLFHFDATYPGLFAVVPNTPYSDPTPANQGGVIGLMPTTNVWRQNSQLLTSMLNEWGFALPYANNAAGSSLTAWNAKKFQLIAPGLDYEYGGSQYEPPTPTGRPSEGRYYAPIVPQTGSQGTQYITNGDRDNLTNFIDSKIEDYVP